MDGATSAPFSECLGFHKSMLSGQFTWRLSMFGLRQKPVPSGHAIHYTPPRWKQEGPRRWLHQDRQQPDWCGKSRVPNQALTNSRSFHQRNSPALLSNSHDDVSLQLLRRFVDRLTIFLTITAHQRCRLNRRIVTAW